MQEALEVADTVYSEAETKSGTVFTSHSQHSQMSKGDIETNWHWDLLGQF
jgi:hypothetical protein